MRITVDPWRCQGHMQCIAIAPHLFEYDDEKSHTVPCERVIAASEVDVARRAAVACPERAITLEDEDV